MEICDSEWPRIRLILRRHGYGLDGMPIYQVYDPKRPAFVLNWRDSLWSEDVIHPFQKA